MNMKKGLAAWVLMLTMSSMAQGQDEITGTWLTQEQNSKVEIYKNGTGYHGKIVWLENPTNKKGDPVTDRNNPDKNLKNRPIMGLDMLQDLQYQEGKWIGKIYSPKRGLTLDAELMVEGGNQLKVKVSRWGFTREQLWTRDSL